MKNAKYSLMFLFVILTIPFMAFTCEDKVEGGHKYIAFINNSNEMVYITEKGQMRILPHDTLYDCNNKAFKTLPNDTIYLEPLNTYWETDFKVRDIVMYFVFPELIPSLEFCEEVRKHQLKRYQFTEKDLIKMDWTITYP